MLSTAMLKLFLTQPSKTVPTTALSKIIYMKIRYHCLYKIRTLNMYYLKAEMNCHTLMYQTSNSCGQINRHLERRSEISSPHVHTSPLMILTVRRSANLRSFSYIKTSELILLFDSAPRERT